MKNDKSCYEAYHNKTGLQKKFLPENNFTHFYSFKVIKKYLKGRNALEIGCGAGSNTFFMANNGIKTTAIDISKAAIQKCIDSSKVLNIQNLTNFRQCDFIKYKSNKKFDLVVCFEVIEHLENDGMAIKKIAGLLNKHGVALVSVPSENAFLNKVGYAKSFDQLVGHIRRYNEKNIIKICKEANLNIVEVYKVEGPIRDLLFIIKPFNYIVKFLKYTISDIVNNIDSVLVKWFGESRIILVLEK